MSAISPPQSRVWYKQPLDRVEGTWIVIAFAWCLVMFFMMPYWHVTGKQNLANEAYRTTPERFTAKAQEMVDKHKVREETEQKIPVVSPPAGSDVYLIDPALGVHGHSMRARTHRSGTTDSSIWFHQPVFADQWNLLESMSPAAARGRGVVTGSLMRADGVITATLAQEGLIAERD